MTSTTESPDDSLSNEKSSWYNYFVDKFHSLVSYFKFRNPIGNIVLHAEDFGFENLPFDDYSHFEETQGLN